MVRSISSRWGIAATVPLRFCRIKLKPLGNGLIGTLFPHALEGNSTSKLFERTLIFWPGFTR